MAAAKAKTKKAAAPPAAAAAAAKKKTRSGPAAAARLARKARINTAAAIAAADAANPSLNVRNAFKPSFKPSASSSTLLQRNNPASKSKSKAKSKRRERAVIAALRRLPAIDPSHSALADAINNEDAIDDQERELSELVFGADAVGALARALNHGVHATARSHAHNAPSSDHTAAQQPGTDTQLDTDIHNVLGFAIDTLNDTEHVDDAGADALIGQQSHAPSTSVGQQDTVSAPAAWADDDDNNNDNNDGNGFMVDIRKKKRLRKLRSDFDEHAVAAPEYERRLRAQYERMFPTPKWAALPDSTNDAPAATTNINDDDDDDDGAHAPRDGSGALQTTSAATNAKGELGQDALMRLLQTTRPIAAEDRARSFPPDRFIAIRLKDANQLAPSQSVVQTAAFHPTAPVLLTCGLDKTLRLFQIDGRVNPKIQSVYFKDTPIFSAQFTADGRQVIVCGRRKWFYVHDLATGATSKIWDSRRGVQTKSYEHLIASSLCGQYLAFLCRDGCVAIVSAHTKQWLGDIKLNGMVVAATFAQRPPDMNDDVNDDATTTTTLLYAINNEGDVYVWDVATRTCIHRFHDDGCVKATAIAVSPTHAYIATGQSTGITNIYTVSTAMSSSTPKPLRALHNLTTPVTTIVFDPLDRCIVIASHAIRDALRVVHLPSLTVFPNWPTQKTPLGHVSHVAFDPLGLHLAVANAKGRVLLYRI